MARQMTDAPVEVFASGSLAGQPTAEGADDELLTAKQAAELVGVTVERIRTLASDERVPATMVSHKWWFSKRELERIKAECPQVLYARRTPAVAAVTQARREKSRATMFRLNAMRGPEDRHRAALAGYYGLLAKIAREIDPADALDPEERERRVMAVYRAQMAEARAKKSSAQRTAARITQPPMTREAMIAEAEQRARAQVAQEHGDGGHGAGANEPLAICFQCWRENIGGRPPGKLVNVLCERHQRENDEFAASLRATS